MKKTVFTGAAVAIVTPMNDDYTVNYDVLGEMIEYQIENGTDAIVICGTTGESSTLNDEEHVQVIKYAVDKVNKRVPVIAGTGSNDTLYATELSIEAEKLGADALLLVTPYYNKTTQKGLIEHYRYIADRVNIPIILYNVPSRTGVDIKPETYLELSKHPNIVAIKEANGNISSMAKTMSLVGDNMDLYTGNDDQIVPSLALGAKGVISVISNIMPQETHDICEFFAQGDVQASLNLQLEMLELINAIFVEVNPIPVKEALNLLGKNAGPARLPLTKMSEGNLEILKKALSKFFIV